jgi:hypothetical protein
MLTGAQIFAARELLNWSVADLSAWARVSPVAIQHAETADGPPYMHKSNLLAIRRALEKAGIEFFWGAHSDDGRSGVRLRSVGL